jgi:drug/metabolite transporter (DMT)-like permease
MNTTHNTTKRATMIGSISILLWGTLALLTQLTEGRIPPFQLLSMTFFVAFMMMLTRWKLQEGHWGMKYARQPLFAWFHGVVGLFGYHFCYFLAMSYAPAVEVSLLAYLWPLFIVLFAALLPGEQLKKQHFIGAIVALSGCWFLIGNNGSGFSSTYITGYLLAFSCSLIWSSYSVIGRMIKQVPTDAVGWFCGATAVLGLVSHLIWETTIWPNTTIQWIGVLGLGLGPVGVAFFTWDYGVKHGNLQLLGVLSYSAPLISTILLIVGGITPASISILVAAVAICLGAFIASRP